jgi:putative OPT family oligopeptide transporter
MSRAGGEGELTAKALVLGVALSVMLSAANAYLGLFAGMTVSASIPAAVISMGLLTALTRARVFKGHTIRENNLVQTAASAGESLAAGVIFTFPALVMLGTWQRFSYLETSLIAALGGVLGVLFTIPLRRALVRPGGLTFPEGVATAEVLRTGERGDARGLLLIAAGAAAGGLMKFLGGALAVFPEAAERAFRIGQSGLAYAGSNLSPALLSVGYIVRLNIAVLVFAGGAVSWFVAIPIWYAMYGSPDPDLRQPADIAWTIWTTKIRYLGVGAMAVGGLWALISIREPLLAAVASGLRAAGGGSPGDESQEIVDTERDVPMRFVLAGVIACVLPIAGVYVFATGQLAIAVPMALVMITAGFLFSAVAAYMAGLVGSSNNPISGVTIATVLLASLVLAAIMGTGAGAEGAAAAILVAAVVCCAAAISGDTMQDFKAGQLVGATPWKQQVMELVGVVAAAAVVAPVLNILLEAYGFGPKTELMPNALQAPQATLMASVARGVFDRDLPWGMIAIGAGIAAAIIAADRRLDSRGSEFRMPVLAVAVGIYLPLALSVPILAGGVIAKLALEVSGGEQAASHRGVLLASGLITGEALVGIGIAIPIAASGDKDFFHELVAAPSLGPLPGVILLVGIGVWLLWTASRRS